MAYNEFLADRIRTRLNAMVQVEEKKMMGGLIFMINNKMCLGIDIDKKSQKDRLMVRVGNTDFEKLLNKEESQMMDFTGKVMRGFLFINPHGFDTEENLDFWISKALIFNRELIE